MVGHNKGSAVIDVRMKNHPEFGGKSGLYATPYEGVLGKEEWTDKLNTFQALIIWNATQTYSCFLYPAGGLQWFSTSIGGE